MNPELKSRSVGAVIPAFQASASLPAVLNGLLRLLPPDRILIVDDGSTDGTLEAAAASGVICLRHESNRGKGSALASGLLHARVLGWDWAVTLDADGQHATEDVEKLLAVNPGERTGIVVGSRPRAGTAMPWHRRFSNAFSTWIVSRLARGPVFDAQCGFRAYRLDILDALPREGRFEWEAQALILCRRGGMEVETIPIRSVYAGQGSHIRLGRDTWRFLRMAGRLAWTR